MMPTRKCPQCVFTAIALAAAWLGSIAPVNADESPLLGPPAGQIESYELLGDGALIDITWLTSSAEDYAIFLGTSPGERDIQSITHLSVRFPNKELAPVEQSLPVGIPIDGRPFFLRFFWIQPGGEWQYEDVEYIAPLP